MWPASSRGLTYLDQRDATTFGSLGVQRTAGVTGKWQRHLVHVQHPRWRESPVLQVELGRGHLEDQVQIPVERPDGLQTVDLICFLDVVLGLRGYVETTAEIDSPSSGHGLTIVTFRHCLVQ